MYLVNIIIPFYYFQIDGSTQTRGRVVWCNLRDDSEENSTEDKEVQTEQEEASLPPNIPVIVTPSSQYCAKIPEEDKTSAEPEMPPRSMEDCLEIYRGVSFSIFSHLIYYLS